MLILMQIHTQGFLFEHTDNTLVWFTLGNGDLIIDNGGKLRKKGQMTRARFTPKANSLLISRALETMRIGSVKHHETPKKIAQHQQHKLACSTPLMLPHLLWMS